MAQILKLLPFFILPLGGEGGSRRLTDEGIAERYYRNIVADTIPLCTKDL